MELMQYVLVRPVAFLLVYMVAGFIGVSIEMIGAQVLFEDASPPGTFGWAGGLLLSAWFSLIYIGAVNLIAVWGMAFVAAWRKTLSLVFPLIVGAAMGFLPLVVIPIVRRLTHNDGFGRVSGAPLECLTYNFLGLLLFLAVTAVYFLFRAGIVGGKSDPGPPTPPNPAPDTFPDASKL